MQPHIVVAGAGWAGISAAIHAVRRGARVTLVEERPYVGGRARSVLDKTANVMVDNGQHVMMGCYSDVLTVLNELGTTNFLERQRALQVIFAERGGTTAKLDASALPGKLGVVYGLLKMSGLSFAAKRDIIRLMVRIQRRVVQGSGRTCYELLRDEQQREAAITRFWEPVVLATLNMSVRSADADLLLTVMARAFLGSRDDAAMLIPRQGLSDLIDPIGPWLQRHGSVMQLSTSVDRLHTLPETTTTDASTHSTTLRVNRVVISDGTELDVDGVILAVPRKALDRLLQNSSIPIEFPDPPAQSPIVSVYLHYDRPWMPTDFAACLGTTIQWVFDKRRQRPGTVALTVSAGDNIVAATSDDIIKLADRELRDVFSQHMSAVQLTSGLVIKEKTATPAFTPVTARQRPPGDALRNPGIRRMNNAVNNVSLAGDWLDTGLPATLEGAALSGRRAVEILLGERLTGDRPS
ncbi:MAG TPA: hydroxysqualene dehydroxylase HpnE [Chlorobiota bacterium]|nr:hydroxysqualene dehydroxylase HpnE [Chlorobiota bacterium]